MSSLVQSAGGSSGTDFSQVSGFEMFLRSVVGNGNIASASYYQSSSQPGVSYTYTVNVAPDGVIGRVNTITLSFSYSSAGCINVFGQGFGSFTPWPVTFTPNSTTISLIQVTRNSSTSVEVTAFTLTDGTTITSANRWEGL